MDDLARLAGQLGQRRGARVLVLDRRERELDAGQPPDLRAPDPGGAARRVGRGSCPSAVWTARTRPRSTSKPVTSQCAERAHAAPAVARHRLGGAHAPWRSRRSGVCRPPRIRSGSISGTSSAHLPGSSSSARARTTGAAPAPLQLVPALARRARPRCPPTGWKHAVELELKSATVSCAKRVIVRDGLCWKTRPGACEVDPPVSHSGPWSTQHDVAPAELGEVVGDAGADDAPADDHDAGLTRGTLGQRDTL